LTATLTATSADGGCGGWVVGFIVGRAEGVAEGVDGLALEAESYVGVNAGGDADVGIRTSRMQNNMWKRLGAS
jgi:hypothetical protein